MHEDDGFTLVEMLVAMAIMLIITTPLTAAVMQSLRTTATENRLRDSNSEQIAAAYFSRDVASARTVQAAPGCTGVPSVVASFRWTDPGPTGDTARAADWSVLSGQLVRTSCVVGSAGERIAVGKNVASATCTSPCTTVSGTTPRTLALVVQQPAPESRTFTLKGTRRAT